MKLDTLLNQYFQKIANVDAGDVAKMAEMFGLYENTADVIDVILAGFMKAVEKGFVELSEMDENVALTYKNLCMQQYNLIAGIKDQIADVDIALSENGDDLLSLDEPT